MLRSLWSDKCIQLSGNAASLDSKLCSDPFSVSLNGKSKTQELTVKP
jgi:hypothetical protein